MSWHRHLISQPRQPGRADPADLLKLVDGTEGAMFGAPVHDALRGDLADSGERVELSGGGRIEVELPGFRGRTTGRCRFRGRRGNRNTDVDLLAVGQSPGQVEGAHVRTGKRATGRAQGIGYPGAAG